MAVQWHSARFAVVMTMVLLVGLIASAAAVAAEVTRYENYHPGITYSGTWNVYNAAGYSGTPAGYTWSSTAGDTVSFPFDGTGIDWITVMFTNQGFAEVWVDSETPELIDLYAPTRQLQQVVWSKRGLSNGPHVLNIRVTGDKRPESTLAAAGVDAFDVFVDPPVVSTAASSFWSLGLLAVAGLGTAVFIRRRRLS